MSTARTHRIAREAALTAGAVLGVLCVLTALAAPLLGVRLLVFMSGSMSPAMETGAVAVSRTVDAADLARGDVVSVTNSDGQRVTHRITDLTPAGDQVVLQLKGDANANPDAESYPVTEADRVVWHMDGLGYVVDALASPYAVFAAGAGAAGLLVLTFRRRSESEPGVPRDAGDEPDGAHDNDGAAGGACVADEETNEAAHRSRRAGALVSTGLAVTMLAAVVATSSSGAVTPTLAAFSDSAAVTSSLATLTVPAPASLDCTNGEIFSGRVYIGWPAVTNAPTGFNYLVETYTDDPADPIRSYVVDSQPEDGNVVTTIPRADLPGPGIYHVAVYGSLDGTTWRSVGGVDRTIGAGVFGHEINC